MAESLSPYSSKYLRVHLTEGHITSEQIAPEILRDYLGGACLGAKILYDEIPRSTSWTDPENRLVIASGPLGGTRINGSGTISVATVGALTGGATISQANGFLGAFLRFNGYDGIILQGAAPRLTYLYIHDGKAELRDATHLAGVDTWDMIDRLAEELDTRPSQISVFGIGPAGENLAQFAAIVGDRGHVAGHNGTGAVMGSKRLKALVVQRARGQVPTHQPELLSEIAHQIFESIDKQGTYRWGTLPGVKRNATGYGLLPIKNYMTNVWDISPEQLDTWDGPYIQEHHNPQRHSCWACRFNHCTLMTIPEGPRKGFVGEEPEYEQYAAFGPVIDNKDAEEALFLANQCDRLGFENNEMGWLIGFVMECYEEGLLTREQLGGLDMRWGNTQATYELMRKIASREGAGDILAKGVKGAAEQIGGEALQIAIYTMRGNSPRGHDHRVRWTEMLDTATSDTGTMEIGPMFGMPADVLKLLGIERLPGLFSPEEVVAFNAKTSGAMLFEDSLGVCRFNTRTDLPSLVEALNAATGWNVTVEEALRIGRRAMNLLRAFNIQGGMRSDLDRLSLRYGSTPVDGPSEGKAIQPHWEKMVSEYYTQIGWDERGMPTRETLESLGLAQVANDLDLA
ncbi:MAG: hypothetical protein A2Y73_02010 [Chloroflexi bacterium RBG_13_56_8]|nr:MAG: hypothetical protein A2Y73_02010 [Chloroflexi bacterium RBG_13_56_8]